MIGIATVGTNDMARACRFYAAVPAPLGAGMNGAWSTDQRNFQVAGPGLPMVAVARPFDGAPATPGDGAMTALAAPTRALVDAVALAAGGGRPAPRPCPRQGRRRADGVHP